MVPSKRRYLLSKRTFFIIRKIRSKDFLAPKMRLLHLMMEICSALHSGVRKVHHLEEDRSSHHRGTRRHSLQHIYDRIYTFIPSGPWQLRSLIVLSYLVQGYIYSCHPRTRSKKRWCSWWRQETQKNSEVRARVPVICTINTGTFCCLLYTSPSPRD